MRGRVYDSGHFSVKSAQFQNEFMWNIQEKRSLYIHGRVKISRGRHVVCLQVLFILHREQFSILSWESRSGGRLWKLSLAIILWPCSNLLVAGMAVKIHEPHEVEVVTSYPRCRPQPPKLDQAGQEDTHGSLAMESVSPNWSSKPGSNLGPRDTKFSWPRQRGQFVAFFPPANTTYLCQIFLSINQIFSDTVTRTQSCRDYQPWFASCSQWAMFRPGEEYLTGKIFHAKKLLSTSSVILLLIVHL